MLKEGLRLMGAAKVFLKNRGVQLHPLHPSNGDSEYSKLKFQMNAGPQNLHLERVLVLVLYSGNKENHFPSQTTCVQWKQIHGTFWLSEPNIWGILIDSHFKNLLPWFPRTYRAHQARWTNIHSFTMVPCFLMKSPHWKLPDMKLSGPWKITKVVWLDFCLSKRRLKN